jgi:hypothetical protein
MGACEVTVAIGSAPLAHFAPLHVARRLRPDTLVLACRAVPVAAFAAKVRVTVADLADVTRHLCFDIQPWPNGLQVPSRRPVFSRLTFVWVQRGKARQQGDQPRRDNRRHE